MNRQKFLFRALAAFISLVFLFSVVLFGSQLIQKEVVTKSTVVSEHCDTSIIQRTIKQRDDVSRQLNRLQERHQRLVCRRRMTTETGGWCGSLTHTSHQTDEPLVYALANLFAGRTVVGLGDGRGIYRKMILSTGKVHTYDAYDGSPNIYNISGGEVKFMDLTLPQYWLPRYDWVLTLEVLEHIREQFETIAIDNIDRAAGHGVVLSWAIPRQFGRHHVNCRSTTYVKDLMLRRGFTFDMKASLSLREHATFHYFINNTMVFIRQ